MIDIQLILLFTLAAGLTAEGPIMAELSIL